jgi:hypothetical protein
MGGVDDEVPDEVVGDEAVPRSRERFRKQRRARRRRQAVGAVLVVLGLGLSGVGLAMYLSDDPAQVPTRVEPVTLERTTTTVAP